jgi:hypothetical protein
MATSSFWWSEPSAAAAAAEEEDLGGNFCVMITPLYTSPKPPSPRTFRGWKLEVADFSSAYLNSRSSLHDADLVDSSEEAEFCSLEAEDPVSSTLLLLLLLLLVLVIPAYDSAPGRTLDDPRGDDADAVVDSEMSPLRRALTATADDSRRRCGWWSCCRDLVSCPVHKISASCGFSIPTQSCFQPKQDIDDPL